MIARVPVLGGTPQYLVEEVWVAFSLSPDGRQIAFFRGYSSPQDVAAIDGGNPGRERRDVRLIRSKPGELWFTIWGGGPAWSPDGQRIVMLAGGLRTAAGYYSLPARSECR